MDHSSVCILHLVDWFLFDVLGGTIGASFTSICVSSFSRLGSSLHVWTTPARLATMHRSSTCGITNNAEYRQQETDEATEESGYTNMLPFPEQSVNDESTVSAPPTERGLQLMCISLRILQRLERQERGGRLQLPSNCKETWDHDFLLRGLDQLFAETLYPEAESRNEYHLGIRIQVYIIDHHNLVKLTELESRFSIMAYDGLSTATDLYRAMKCSLFASYVRQLCHVFRDESEIFWVTLKQEFLKKMS